MLVVLACFLGNRALKFSCGIISLFASFVIIAKMMYQLFKIPEDLLDLLCFVVSMNLLKLRKPILLNGINICLNNKNIDICVNRMNLVGFRMKTAKCHSLR